MPITRDEFAQMIAQAYDHLYDMAFLRDHPLIELIHCKDPAESSAWRLHQALVDAIEELNPSEEAPIDSPPWRRYRLLYQHYVEGDGPQAVADLLGISRRHFYRERDKAMTDLATLWWHRVLDRLGLEGTAESIEIEHPAERISLLRQEAERVTSVSGRTQLAAVVAHAHGLSQALLRQYGVESRVMLAEDLPPVQADAQVLLHVVLGLIQYGVWQPGAETLSITGSVNAEETRLTIEIRVAHGQAVLGDRSRLHMLRELASTQGMDLDWRQAGAACRYELAIPAFPVTTVLVVDDNPDIHDLFRRYLSGYGYRAVVARDAEEANTLLDQIKPDAITLDLMMPGQDGLALLHALHTQPRTHDIPVIVCSILEERELALSLGADFVLVKPVTQKDILEALGRVLSG
jgi:CheY-like chemotaxis protein